VFAIAFTAAGNLWATDEAADRAQEFTPTGAFITQFGWKGSEPGQLHEPRGLAIDAKGDVWVTDDANNRLEEWSTGPNAHDAKTIYYTKAANTEDTGVCEEAHPRRPVPRGRVALRAG
jgi:DNA-binding beta-propeller fold protein YncE